MERQNDNTALKNQSNEDDKYKNKQWKGILFFNLNVLIGSTSFLLCQYCYQRNPNKLQPIQLVFFRGLISTITCLLIVNINLKKVLFDEIPRKQVKLLFIRSFIFTSGIVITFFIIKYISLVFQGIIANLTPIVTMILSSIITGERFKQSDIIFIAVSLIGVMIVTIGIIYNQKDDLSSEKSDFSFYKSVLPCLVAFLYPFLNSLAAIINRSLKNLNDITVTTFMNPVLMIAIMIIIAIQGQVQETIDLIQILDIVDWILLTLIGVLSVIFQTLFFVSLKYEEPGKLSQYTYLSVIYQLIFDLFIFDKSFNYIQWFGISILILCYIYKFISVYQTKKKDDFQSIQSTAASLVEDKNIKFSKQEQYNKI